MYVKIITGIGGILPDPERPGFKHILLKPIFPDELDHSEMKHSSAFGEIVSKWRKKGKSVIYETVIPSSSTATFYMPDNVVEEGVKTLSAGKYQIKIKLR